MKNCLLIAGEKSGEEHALSFFRELRSSLGDVHFFGVGGDELQAEGLELVYHLKDFSTWGISEAILKIPYYYKAFRKIEAEVKTRNCKVAILIDFQTFNLKLAQKLEKQGVKVLYYVAPQAWAWKSYRAKVLEKCVDTLFCIIPFEKKWFMDRGVSKAVSIEHPLMNTYKAGLKDFKRKRKDFLTEEVNIVLLPGSRNFEVIGLLPTFVRAVKELKKRYNIKVSIVKSSSVSTNGYGPYDELFDNIYQNEELEKALKNSDLAFAASGTVNLACALYEVPTIVGYTGSLLNEFIYYTFVKYDGHISLPNIVHEQEVFPELIGSDLSVFNIIKHANKLFEDKEHYNYVMDKLSKTQTLISGEDINLPDFLEQKIRKSYES